MTRVLLAALVLSSLACAGSSSSEAPAAEGSVEPRARVTGDAQAQLDSQRQVCAEVSQRLCADLGPETDTCAMVREQTPEIEVEYCARMLAEYDRVLADLRALEAQRVPLAPEAAAKIAGGPEVPSYGPPDAAVTVVTFADFQCPYCAKAAEVNAQMRARYGDRVRFVFRQFPLDVHPQAHLAAEAALAAHAQGEFIAYHDLLFANQATLGRPSLNAFAEQLGLDMQAFQAALAEGSYAARVDADYLLGQEVFVQGTPTVFINEQRLMDATDSEVFAAELERQLSD